ncbi:MAG: hypothetical protein CMH98_13960 [Oceanospirillaceae bacterium]|nr:hypothetical protein [Oceanospirillaceae bacterium]
MHERKLYPAIAAANAGGEPEGVSFDGVNDYLYRNTDFVGNTDSKAFTLSVAFYVTSLSASTIYEASGSSSPGFRMYISLGKLYVLARNGMTVLSFSLAADVLAVYAVNVLQMSFDLSDVNKRHVYVNDRDVTPTVFADYVNTAINFQNPTHTFANNSVQNSALQCRAAHFFLAYEYVNITTDHIRRIFIDENGLPTDDARANWIAAGHADPIIYMPMRTPATAHINEGFGGDFEQSGLLDAASVGFNEWQCVASSINSDLSNTEYLSEPSTGYINYSALTLLFITDGSYWRAYCDNGANPFLDVVIYNTTKSLVVKISQFSPAYINIGSISIPASKLLPRGAMMQIGISVDVANGKWNYCVNGEASGEIAVSFAAGTAQYSNVQIKAPTNYEFKVGEYWQDFSYTNFSGDNPHWDTDLGRPKPVRQVISETGFQPRIAMPVRSGDEGRNFGTTNNFAVYSGPFVGVRGMSEFIARSAKGDGSTGYLSRYHAATNPTKLSVFLTFKSQANYSRSVLDWTAANNEIRFSAGRLMIELIGTAGGKFTAETALTSNDNDWHTVMLSIDTNNASGAQIRYDDTSSYSLTSSTIADQQIKLSGWIHCPEIASPCSFDLASYYVCYGDMIDFSNEEIRSIFVDQLGYPKDLSPAIESGAIPRPAFYLKFEDPDDPGLDSSGNNNHFTVNGTVTPGADFNV